MRRLITLLTAVFILKSGLFAQLVIGWNAGFAPARELNREIYVYNAINGHNLSKEMGEVHWYQGPAIGFRTPGEGGYLELLYSRKRVKVASEFDSSGVLMTRELKTLCNTWNFGLGFQSDGWRIGFSWDLGRFKGFGRRGPESTIGDTDWQLLWTRDDTRILFISVRLICTETVYVEKNFGFMNIRLYAQLPGISNDMDGLDQWLFGSELNFAVSQKQPFVNVGAMISLQIGGN